MSRRAWTTRDRIDIPKALEQGRTVRQLSEERGVSMGALRAFLYRCGASPKQHIDVARRRRREEGA